MKWPYKHTKEILNIHELTAELKGREISSDVITCHDLLTQEESSGKRDNRLGPFSLTPCA